MTRATVVVGTASLLFGCGKSEAVTHSEAIASASAAIASAREAIAQVNAILASAVPVETPAEQIAKLGYADALFMARPYMTGTAKHNQGGAELFGLWAAKRMVWADVSVANDETSWGLTMKDPDETLGKRLCTTGQIIEIAVEATGGGDLGIGLSLSNSGNLFRFLAAGSTGDLVAGSHCRFCGVVAGRYDYPNSGGGTGHAVSIVGMFQLPENVRKKPD